MAQFKTSFPLNKFFIKGFDLPSFDADVRAIDYGVAVDSVALGNLFVQSPADDEVVIVFSDTPTPESLALLYEAVLAYEMPPPA